MDEQSEKIELGALHEREKRLIFAIRTKYRYGELKIITRDGLPFRLKISERFEDLSSEEKLSTLQEEENNPQ